MSADQSGQSDETDNVLGITAAQAVIQEVLSNDYLMRQDDRVAHLMATRLHNQGLLSRPGKEQPA